MKIRKTKRKQIKLNLSPNYKNKFKTTPINIPCKTFINQNLRMARSFNLILQIVITEFLYSV